MKFKKRIRITLQASAMLLALALALAAPMQAHHGSRASYQVDIAKELTLPGTITRFEWRNPHVYVLFDVTDDKGNVVHWAAETNPPYMLSKHGWSKDMVKPGDAVTISLFPSKAGTPVGLLSKISFNGKELVDEDLRRAAGAP